MGIRVIELRTGSIELGTIKSYTYAINPKQDWRLSAHNRAWAEHFVPCTAHMYHWQLVPSLGEVRWHLVNHEEIEVDEF